jgi:single-strand DNA-binding protein
MYQKLIIVGNLGRDPEMRYTPSGQAVTNFSVATNRKWTGGDGQLNEETVWFRVSAWGKLAETCNQYLTKGQKVFCEGRLTVDRETGGPRVWTDQSGNPRASYEMTALEVKFLGGRSDDGGGGSYDGGSDEGGGDPGMTEDEIPF